MGFEKIKRPILARGIQVLSSGASTSPGSLSGDIVLSDDLRMVGDLTFTAGGVVADVETLTSTASVLQAFGLSLLAPAGTTADKTFSLARPAAVGVTKSVIFRTTGVRVTNVTVAGATASGFFEGTTFRTLIGSSLSTKQRSATLMSFSTNQWAIVSKSTGVTLV